jgi:hypothetical protein
MKSWEDCNMGKPTFLKEESGISGIPPFVKGTVAALVLAASLFTAGCADVPAITSPQVQIPFPSMSAETKQELTDCCTITVTTPKPEGTVDVAHKLKPGTEHIWQYLAGIKDYKNAVDVSRALTDAENH